MNRPSLRLPYHHGTTANVASVYPFSVQPSFGHRGVLVGTDLLAGGAEFCWDPFEAYDQGLVTNPNCWILGEPGNGKSALVKTLLFRQAAIYGTHGARRWVSIVDPKGEYTPLAVRLGYTAIRLSPAGHTRINPLDPQLAGPGHDPQSRLRRQAEFCTALLATVLDRNLNQHEDAVLYDALGSLASAGADVPTLSTLAAVIARPQPTDPIRTDRRDAGDTLSLALDKLLHRSLQGMFDGPSTVDTTGDGPGIVIDLSALGPSSDALGVVMAASTAWLQELTTRPGPQRVQVLDEAWALLGNRHTAGYLQRAFKLGRATGSANLCIAHRVSDLAAQADDGTATAKIADGLLADSATKVLLRQAADQIDTTAERVGLTQAEASVVTRLVRGRAVWKLGSRTAVVHHTLAPIEEDLCNTDSRMRPHDA